MKSVFKEAVPFVFLFSLLLRVSRLFRFRCSTISEL
jgi:hypothetical protein